MIKKAKAFASNNGGAFVNNDGGAFVPCDDARGGILGGSSMGVGILERDGILGGG